MSGAGHRTAEPNNSKAVRSNGRNRRNMTATVPTSSKRVKVKAGGSHGHADVAADVSPRKSLRMRGGDSAGFESLLTSAATRSDTVAAEVTRLSLFLRRREISADLRRRLRPRSRGHESAQTLE